MLSSNLLFSVCETFGNGITWITVNDESAENEIGTIGEMTNDLGYQLTSGKLIIGSCYLLSEIPLHEAMPTVIFSHKDGGKTSMFGYLMDDEPTEFVI